MIRKGRRNKGFTFIEIIAAIGVIITAIGLSGVDAGDITRGIDQTRAEAKAKQIYVSAQEKITKLYTSGATDVLERNGQELDYDVTNYNGKNNLKFVTSEDPDAALFCDFKDDDGGSFIIEYDPKSGRVYGAFYTSEKLDFYKGDKTDNKYRSFSREDFLKFADDNKYNIAYNGGGELNNALVDNKQDRPEQEKPEMITPEDPPEKPDPDIDLDLNDGGLVYWEEYVNINTNEHSHGIYYVYNITNGNDVQRDYLKYGDEYVVVADGYGVAVGKGRNEYIYMDRKCDINTVCCFTKDGVSDYSVVQLVENDKGVLYRFPTSWVDEAEANFYSRLGFWLYDKPVDNMYKLVNPDPIYINMRFARNGIYVGKGNTNPTYENAHIENTLYVRSARQLYDLSLYYSKFAIGSEGTVVVQDINIDYSLYDWANYTTTVSSYANLRQTPIGTNAFTSSGSKGTFMMNYYAKGKDGVDKDENGNDIVHKISGIKLVAANGYSGLFSRLRDYPYRINGKLVDSGNVKGLEITGTIESAKYTGLVTGYQEKNTSITSCSGLASGVTALYGGKEK